MTSARRFHGLPESVPAARRFTRDALRDQSSEVVDAAELMVSELATNCIQHAQTDFEITIETRDQVRIEVHDADHDGRPEVQSPPPEAPSGRGLRIVQEISDEWGIVKSSDGKTVWFVLDRGPAPSPDQPRAHVSASRAPEEPAAATKANVPGERGLLRLFRRGPRALDGELDRTFAVRRRALDAQRERRGHTPSSAATSPAPTTSANRRLSRSF